MYWPLKCIYKDNLTEKRNISSIIQKIDRLLRGRAVGHLLTQNLSGLETD